MAKRKIIKIDEAKCNGCGQCIPNCPEGALQIIDEKARLISDLFCDGLGACIGHCPQDAITVEEREAEEYNESKVMENVIKQGENVIKAHLEHLKDHHQHQYLQQAIAFLKEKKIEVPQLGHQDAHVASGCPGVKVMEFAKKQTPANKGKSVHRESELRQWPVQIKLVPPAAPYFKDADLLVAADCVPFAYADFHQELLKDKKLLIGCPKLDDAELYKEKIAQILKQNEIKSITCAHMEVPCCFGLVNIIKEAIELSGKNIPFRGVTVGIQGEIK
ncbi:MAG: 4Fe-4S binding protein [Candidatus Omnitrophica bacterium]|nr:4Fe-4S binding protein [Candidatus Omnitrophota bacterium]